ncbi:MAG: signal recognition particle-docking protein FtsY [Ignavibacteriales bacterium]|nr:signal recognition particle-docking protein FtsY [Ignavibacteriales bacterium]
MNPFKNVNFEKLKRGLTKSRKRLAAGVAEALTGKATIDEETMEELEEALISADIGFDVVERTLENTRSRLANQADRGEGAALKAVRKELAAQLERAGATADYEPALASHKPFVILVVGVNGAGKTTTVGKLARNFKRAGKSVIVGAADTYRAAANEQLEVWAERAEVDVLGMAPGSDPSAVAYRTVETAKREGIDVAIVDTAGRLHTKANLMSELGKIGRAVAKLEPTAPHETFLVVDGGAGQNAVQQAERFSEATPLTGLIVAKLDGTAKGGALFRICDALDIPVRYVGVGEGIEDLQNFDPRLFVEALFNE